jgi:hypothetical protein
MCDKNSFVNPVGIGKPMAPPNISRYSTENGDAAFLFYPPVILA